MSVKGKKNTTKRAPATKKKSGSASSFFATGDDIKKKDRKRQVKQTYKKKKRNQRELPDWIYWSMASLFVAVLLLGAYRILIVPNSFRWKPCYGSKAYELCVPNGYSIYGIDVSHHQGRIDWKQVAQANDNGYTIDFAIIKATEGGTFKDSLYNYNMESARREGIICGAYHFYNPATSPRKQAEFFIANAGLVKGDIIPVVDVEKRGDSKAELQRELIDFLSILENHYGVKPIIYTSAKFRERYLDNAVLNEYPLWVAHYHTEVPDTQSEWVLWQYSDRSKIQGINTNTDFNIFAGNKADLEKIRF
ncbi:MAG: glycoside hydrolase family 25 protein [Bacteroidaceae bacterium]|jgi:lysozyme|nr:glycoside hydrolase family 25 protein [Bacteroidaceae bacterium]